MKIKTFFLASAITASMAMNASAVLMLTPADADDSGNQTSNSQIETYLETTYGVNTEDYYKDNVGGIEEGDAAGFYTTTYGVGGLEESAQISWDGPGKITGSPIYLVVKDGNEEPAWYLFDITGWDGMELIQLSAFWPDNGAISHISIYGDEDDCCETPGVPDAGASLMLLGMALVGVEGLRRRLTK